MHPIVGAVVVTNFDPKPSGIAVQVFSAGPLVYITNFDPKPGGIAVYITNFDPKPWGQAVSVRNREALHRLFPGKFPR